MIRINIYGVAPPLHSSQETSLSNGRLVTLWFPHLLLAVVSVDHVPVLFGFGVAFLAFHVPSLKVAAEREQQSVDRRPGEEDTKVEPDPRVQVEQDRPRRLDDVV